MNCIDAVEGTAKVLLDKFMASASDQRLDASEYIRTIKTVIEGVDRFVTDNPEISETPDLVRDVLYEYAKMLWLSRLEETFDPGLESTPQPDIDYHAYCYDYIYNHGNYPN